MDKHYLLYFGTVFLWAEVDLPSGTVGNLIEPNRSFKDAISHDIALLQRAEFTSASWSVKGKFMRLPNTNIWLFRHSSHVNCSSVTYSHFSRMCLVMEHVSEMSECINVEQHDGLEPFFVGNMALKRLYTRLASLPDDDRKVYAEEQLEKVTKVLNGSLSHEDTPFFTPGIANLRPVQFGENVWSRRLAFSLKEFLPRDLRSHVQYTAEDGPLFGFKQTLKSGIPNDPELLSCYIFWCIRYKYQKPTINGGYR